MCVFVTNNLRFRVLKPVSLASNGIECVWLHLIDLNVIFMCIYILPAINIEHAASINSYIISSFDSLLIDLCEPTVLICSDFNTFDVSECQTFVFVTLLPHLSELIPVLTAFLFQKIRVHFLCKIPNANTLIDYFGSVFVPPNNIDTPSVILDSDNDSWKLSITEDMVFNCVCKYNICVYSSIHCCLSV